MTVGIIGGSGFKHLIEEGREVTLKSPFGKVEALISELNGVQVIFILRHGFKTHVPPHLVNYKAIIYSLRRNNAFKVISLCAVGSINPFMKPGDIVLLDQFIDFTKARKYTFYESKAVHVDMTNPYSRELRRILIENARRLSIKVWEKATYVCTEGPRFETKAEIEMFRILGGDVVGMTSVPEAVLARELGLSYASIAVVSNLAAGLQDTITQEEVFRVVSKSIPTVRKLLHFSLPEIESAKRDEECLMVEENVKLLLKELESSSSSTQV